ncbi:unnamed protein product [Ilex paraguariensis]|uniref:Uncharacterized protein n=1 Tax=Ilex paraguariensis TaxID=185542 RepID=A0ABC8QXT3_9AQUA
MTRGNPRKDWMDWTFIILIILTCAFEFSVFIILFEPLVHRLLWSLSDSQSAKSDVVMCPVVGSGPERHCVAEREQKIYSHTIEARGHFAENGRIFYLKAHFCIDSWTC